MSKLHPLHINLLRLHFDPLPAPLMLFGTLPRPFPKLMSSRREALTDVTTVYGAGTYSFHELNPTTP